MTIAEFNTLEIGMTLEDTVSGERLMITSVTREHFRTVEIGLNNGDFVRGYISEDRKYIRELREVIR